MSRLNYLLLFNVPHASKNAPFNNSWRKYSTAAAALSKKSTYQEEDEFRVLSFTKKRERFQRREVKKIVVPPPRMEQMSTEQNWSNVWSGPRSFHPACVPLSLHQGYVASKHSPPAAYANAELMKIPNFLHLTPPAIRTQCMAIKKFCTPWPAGLETDEKCDEHFPLETITSDYCHSSPSIRNNLSRIISIRVKLSKIHLNYHAKDKLRRLVGERYDPETDLLTIVTDRCPIRKQNLDFANYLLAAVFHESWTVEPWEKEKIEVDMEVYIWDRNPSKKALVKLANWGVKEEITDEDVEDFDPSSITGGFEHKEATSELMNEGENDYTLYKYKMATKKLFGFGDKDDLVIDKANKV